MNVFSGTFSYSKIVLTDFYRYDIKNSWKQKVIIELSSIYRNINIQGGGM